MDIEQIQRLVIFLDRRFNALLKILESYELEEIEAVIEMIDELKKAVNLTTE